MQIEQGDIYYVNLGEPEGSEPGYWHYIVVVQSNTFNRTRVKHVVACVLTSKLKKRAGINGNVIIEPAESNLPDRTVVNITQIVTVDKQQMTDKIGKLGGERTDEIIRNLHRALLRGKRA